MKFCAGLTLYNPSDNELRKLQAYSIIFSHVYVVDNSEVAISLNETFKDLKNVEILHQGSNIGLSEALNLMCNSAKESFEFICLLDQDSIFESNYLNSLIRDITLDTSITTAVYSPTVIYNHNFEDYNAKPGFTKVDWAITSGSFVNLQLFDIIGGFDDAYFIDRLDYDYCYSAKVLGYEIKRSNGALLLQSLGTSRSVFGFKFYQHSPLRNYYSFRNRLYFYFRKRKSSISIVNYSLVFFLSIKQIIKILAIEDCKSQKLKFIVIAIKDYYVRKMGKF